MKMFIRFSLLLLPLLISVSSIIASETDLFNRIDTDKSGHISKEELLKSDLVVTTSTGGQKIVVHRDMIKDGEAAALTEEQKHNLFKNIDSDKDNYLNSKEWSRASPDGFILFKF